MDLGIHIPIFTMPGGAPAIGPTLAEIAQIADEIGVTDLSVMDHYFQMEMMGGPDKEMLEGYTVLGFWAGLTKKVRLALLVTGVTYRHPGLLAKIVSTVDVLSGGRAQLGIGAAWYQEEHAGLGVPFPSTRARYELLEETLQICKQMWSDDDGPYEGKHFKLTKTLCNPMPIGPIPILIGGMGERKTLRLVAKYADKSNFFSQVGPEVIQHKLNVLREHCDNEGRDYDSVTKTLLHTAPPPRGDDQVSTFMRDMETYAKMGIQSVILMPMTDDQPGEVRSLEPLVPRLKALGPG